MKEVYLLVMDWVQLSRSQKGMATLSAWLVPVAWVGRRIEDWCGREICRWLEACYQTSLRQDRDSLTSKICIDFWQISRELIWAFHIFSTTTTSISKSTERGSWNGSLHDIQHPNDSTRKQESLLIKQPYPFSWTNEGLIDKH